MGYSSIDANLMTVPPCECHDLVGMSRLMSIVVVVAALCLFCFVYSSDHLRERSLHSAAALVLAVIGLAVMSTSTNDKLRYGFLFVCLGGAFAPGPLSEHLVFRQTNLH